MKNLMPVRPGTPDDIEEWMKLIEEISPQFPGLQTQAEIDDHRQTVLRFMGSQQALCVKDGDAVAGVLLISRKRNMLCCLAVSPRYRRRGIASMLIEEALRQLDRTKDVTVSTFREDDEKGTAPRALYKKFGFVESDLTVELGYPNQKFILHP